MNILTIRTDKPEAEVGLYAGERQVDYETWQAHRQLAETIHKKIDSMLERNGLSLKDIDGIVCFKGPGSFTGLRIGLTVANALAHGLSIAVVTANGTDWQGAGILRLTKGENEHIAVPEYGGPAHVTQPKK